MNKKFKKESNVIMFSPKQNFYEEATSLDTNFDELPRFKATKKTKRKVKFKKQLLKTKKIISGIWNLSCTALLKGCFLLVKNFIKLLLKAVVACFKLIFSFVRELNSSVSGNIALVLILGLSVWSFAPFASFKASASELEQLEEIIQLKDLEIEKQKETLVKTKDILQKLETELGLDLGVSTIATPENSTNSSNVLTYELVDEITQKVITDMNLPKPSEGMPEHSDHAILNDSLKSQALSKIMDLVAEYNIPLKTKFYDINDWRVLSGLSSEDFNKMLKGTALEGLGYLFVQNEEEHQINGVLTMCLIGLESSWGSSEYAQKYFNFGGIGATDFNTDANVNKSATNRSEGIWNVFNKLKTQYLTSNGTWFNGYGVQDVNQKWCSQISWALKIIRIAGEKTQLLQ